MPVRTLILLSLMFGPVWGRNLKKNTENLPLMAFKSIKCNVCLRVDNAPPQNCDGSSMGWVAMKHQGGYGHQHDWTEIEIFWCPDCWEAFIHSLARKPIGREIVPTPQQTEPGVSGWRPIIQSPYWYSPQGDWSIGIYYKQLNCGGSNE